MMIRIHRENVLRRYFARQARLKLHARDLERINAAAARLNAESEDVLEYQV
ncbi:hypothetical protein [Paracidobacterium acidisoli]|uniref:hypothetical protein n=1 Tax=Paracidobacterium acidisoli TaxID=2303751 RepID=UPI001314212D|nr:hypothetical protein [Paracidobacterium acidisoli]MBT9330555.1 hypothetical protein [Paracidobacterium acidisoli]